ELGLAGVSRDPAWREREDRRAGPSGPHPAEDRGAGLPGPHSGEDRSAVLSGPRSAPLKAPPYDSSEGPTMIPMTQVDALQAVRVDIGDCTRCKLHTLGRTQVVFGVGNPNADLMFVGEAPGAD